MMRFMTIHQILQGGNSVSFNDLTDPPTIPEAPDHTIPDHAYFSGDYGDLTDKPAIPDTPNAPSVNGDYVLNVDSGNATWGQPTAAEEVETTVAVDLTIVDNDLTVTVNGIVSDEVVLAIPDLPDAPANLIDTMKYVLNVPQTSGDATWIENVRPDWDATSGDAFIEHKPILLPDAPTSAARYVLNVPSTSGDDPTWVAESSGDSRITYEDRAPTTADTGLNGDLWIDGLNNKLYILDTDDEDEDATFIWRNEVNGLTLDYVDSTLKLVLRDHNDVVQAEYVLFAASNIEDTDDDYPRAVQNKLVDSNDSLVGSSEKSSRSDHGHDFDVDIEIAEGAVANATKFLTASSQDEKYTGSHVTLSTLRSLIATDGEEGTGILYLWTYVSVILNDTILGVIGFVPDNDQLVAVGSSPLYSDSEKLYANTAIETSDGFSIGSVSIGSLLTFGSGTFNSDGTVQEHATRIHSLHLGQGVDSPVDTPRTTLDVADRVLILPDSAASASEDYVGHYVTVANLIPDIPEDIPAVHIQTSGQIETDELDIEAGDFYVHTGNSLFGIPEQIRLYIDSSSYVSIPPLAGNSSSDNSNIDYIGANIRSTSTVSMADVAAPVSHSHGEVTLRINNDLIELRNERPDVIASYRIFESTGGNNGTTPRASRSDHAHDLTASVDLSTLDLRVTGGQIQLYDDTTEIAVVDIDTGDLGNISSTERNLSFLGFGSTTTTASWIQPQFHVTGGELLLRDSNILGNVYARIDIADIGSGVVLVESDNSSTVNTSRIGKNNNTGEHENAARADHVHQGIIDLMRADVEAGTAGQFLKRSTDSSTSDVEWDDVDLTTDTPGSSLEDDDRFLFINTTQRTNFDVNYSGGFITYSLLLTELESDLDNLVPTPSNDDNKVLTVDGTNYGWETPVTGVSLTSTAPVDIGSSPDDGDSTVSASKVDHRHRGRIGSLSSGSSVNIALEYGTSNGQVLTTNGSNRVSWENPHIFSIHDDVTTRLPITAGLSTADRFVVSDEGETGEPNSFITYARLLIELESDLDDADFSELGLRITDGNLKLDNGSTELDSLRILATPNTVLPEPITTSTLQTTIVGDSTTFSRQS